MKVSTLEELLVDELRDLYDAEKQLVRALPKMAKSAGDSELEQAFREHLEVTKNQVDRLEQVFQMLDTKARGKPCHGMKGLVEEGQEIMGEDFEDAMLDSALLGAARKVEHYEMVGYESVRELAQRIGRKDAAQLLQQTWQEEMQTDRLLAQISKRLVKEAGRPAAKEMERSAGGRRGGRAKQKGGGGQARGGSRMVTDHEEIKRWAEERGAYPTCVRGTGDKDDTGMIRLDFPGYTGEDKLQPVSWEDWFEKFDEKNLALLVQDKTARGQKSNFNKLVSREAPARTRTARG